MAVQNSSFDTEDASDLSFETADATELPLEDLVSRIKRGLAKAQPDASVSVRALTVLLKTEIRKARQNGLSWKSISDVFVAEGIAATPDSIRVYTSTAAPTRAARAKKAGPRLTTHVTVSTKKASVSVEQNDRRAPDSGAASTRRDGATIAHRLK